MSEALARLANRAAVDPHFLAFALAEYARSEQLDDAGLAELVREVMQRMQGAAVSSALPLDIQATAFQRQVWSYLQSIAFGETRSYAQVAQAIRRPSAVRAVARACATNPVPIAIPCHRVVRSDGEMGGYRWGADRKQKLLEMEASN